MANSLEILHGQMIIGPAGSGKTTLCNAMINLMKSIDREIIVINLDPDNAILPFNPHIDISELVQLTDVMQTQNLGPNGSFLFCIDLLSKNFQWLHGRITEEFQKAKFRIDKLNQNKMIESNRRKPYVIFDCPGQIELYTNFPAFKHLINQLGNVSTIDQDKTEDFKRTLDIRLTTVNVVDSFYASDPSKFITVVLNSLTSMLHLETPFVNVLSKIDLIENYGKTDFGIDFYCELPDLTKLVDQISNDPYLKKYRKLTESFASVIENYGLVSYVPVDIKNQDLLMRALALIDRANGFYISDMSSNEDVLNYYRMIQADFEANRYGDLV